MRTITFGALFVEGLKGVQKTSQIQESLVEVGVVQNIPKIYICYMRRQMIDATYFCLKILEGIVTAMSTFNRGAVEVDAE